MKELFETYLHNSISLTAIGILLLALSPLLSRRYSAKCRYLLWLIVLFALILPVRPQILVPVPEIMRPLVAGGSRLIGYKNGGPVFMAKTLDFWRIAAIIWAGGALCYFIWYSFMHLRFMSAVRRWSEEISADKQERFHAVEKEMGIRRQIAIRSCACIRTPMMAGFLRPVILFPEIDLSPDEFTFIVRHELVHYRRKDLYSRVFIMLALIIHWYNPIVHIMVRSALSLCEISCDEEVLKGTGSGERARYGETIIGVIKKGKFYQTALSTNFYSGSKDIKRRIYAMMDMKRKCFSALAVCIVSFIAFCGISAFALTAQSEKPVFGSKPAPVLSAKAAGSVSSGFPADTVEDSENEDRSGAANRIIPTAGSNPQLVAGKQPNSAASEVTSEKSDVILASR